MLFCISHLLNKLSVTQNEELTGNNRSMVFGNLRLKGFPETSKIN